MRMTLEPPSWAEAVFHVLAHVPAPGVPASLYSPWYVQSAEGLLGPASQRLLGHDVGVLGALLCDHGKLAAVQGLAWLWREGVEAAACSGRAFAELREDEVAVPELLPQLRRHEREAELLRCAALLEAEACARLPTPRFDEAALERALTALVPHAPALAQAVLTPMRPLTQHGRVRGNAVWIGVPGCGVTLEEVAMQAAHEASVGEVLARGTGRAERQLEAVALVLLSQRIAGSAHVDAHRTWCRARQVRMEHLDPAGLSPEQRALLYACMRG